MTDPKKIADGLRRYNAWRRNNDGDLTVEMPDPKELGIWIDSAIAVLDAHAENNDLAQRVEKIEADRQAMQLAGTHPAPCARHCEANAYQIEIRGLKTSLKSADSRLHEVAVICATAEQERDALAAELQALREQEPVAWYCDIEDWGREYNGMPGMSNGAIGTPLYARPVPAEPVNARLLERISDAMQSYERHGAICMFEGSPMIYASTLTEIADIAAIAESAIETPAKVSHEND